MQKTALAVRQLLADVFLDALHAVRGEHLVGSLRSPQGDTWHLRHRGREIDWPLPCDGRVVVVGAGKAAASLARGLEAALGDRISDGCIIVKHGHEEPLRRIRQYQAGHPLPDARGVEATEELLRTVSGLTERDSVIVLLTGGASSLMVAPIDGVTLDEKAQVTDLLLRSGASIEEINAVRKRLSRIKGGGLLERVSPASVLTLAISDVPSGDIRMIGSGPTVPGSIDDEDPLRILSHYGLLDAIPSGARQALSRTSPARRSFGGRREMLLLADHMSLVDAVEEVANRRGLPVQLVDSAMNGHTHEAALAMVSALRSVPQGERPRLLLSAGETTLCVKGNGRGGRNQEFALIAALELAGCDDCALLSAGTDGTDGPTNAAGAFADSELPQRAGAAGLNLVDMLERNDSHTLFAATGDLFCTGPTGTNVMDLVLGLAF